MSKKRTGRGSRMGAGAKKSRQARKTGRSWINLPAKWSYFKEESDSIYQIDILPYVVKKVKQHPENESMQDDVWFRFPYKIHRNIGPKKKPMLCPETIGKTCPICETMREMYNDPDVSNKKAQKLVPAKRSLFVVKIKEAKDKKIKGNKYIWDISDANFYSAVDDEIEMGKEDWNNFACLEGGYTIKVRFKEKAFDKITFPIADRIDFIPRKDYPEKILDSNPCLDDMIVPNILSYDEIVKEWKGEKTDKKSGKKENKNIDFDKEDIEAMDETELLEVLEDIGEDIDEIEYDSEDELRELVAEKFGLNEDDSDDEDDDDDDDSDDDEEEEDDDDDDDDEEEEESLEEKINNCKKIKELKQIVKENDEFKSLKKKLKELEGKSGLKKLKKLMIKKISSNQECPNGYEFGKDWAEQDECDKKSCKQFQKCFKAYDKLQDDE